MGFTRFALRFTRIIINSLKAKSHNDSMIMITSSQKVSVSAIPALYFFFGIVSHQIPATVGGDLQQSVTCSSRRAFFAGFHRSEPSTLLPASLFPSYFIPPRRLVPFVCCLGCVSRNRLPLALPSLPRPVQRCTALGPVLGLR